jgi:hypothetical protein
MYRTAALAFARQVGRTPVKKTAGTEVTVP